jgi:hypothetical protein
MPAYDRSFNPPAAVADVTVFHPTTRTSATGRGKLDNGADLTVIPAAFVMDLGLNPKGRIWTRGFDSTYSHRPVFYVTLAIEGFEIPIIRCVATNRCPGGKKCSKSLCRHAGWKEPFLRNARSVDFCYY